MSPKTVSSSLIILLIVDLSPTNTTMSWILLLIPVKEWDLSALFWPCLGSTTWVLFSRWGGRTSLEKNVKLRLLGCSIAVFLLKSHHTGHRISSVNREMHPWFCFWRWETKGQSDPFLTLNLYPIDLSSGKTGVGVILILNKCHRSQLHLSIPWNWEMRNYAFQEKSDEVLLLGNCSSHIFWKNLRTSCTSKKSTSLVEEEGSWQQISKTLSWKDLVGLVEAKIALCLHAPQLVSSTWLPASVSGLFMVK